MGQLPNAMRIDLMFGIVREFNFKGALHSFDTVAGTTIESVIAQ